MGALLFAYNTGGTIYFPLVGTATAAFSTAGSGSLSGTNIYISKDGGALATSTNTGNMVGSGLYSLVLTSSEASAKQVAVLVGLGTLATLVEHQMILIHTFGNASAMYPYDLGTALSAQTVGTVTTVLGGTIGTVTGTVVANVTQFLGTAATGTQGVVKVDVDRVAGTAVNAAAGTLIVNLVANQGTATVGTVSFVASGSVNVTQILATAVVATAGTLTNIGTAGTVLGTGSSNVVAILGTAASATTGVFNVNIIQLAGSATAASQLARGAGNVGSGTATGTLNSTGFNSDLTQTANDHWKGRVVVFISGTLAFQASDVTGYTGSAVGTLSRVIITTLTTAPAAGDQFIIV